jgi:hypothetical protein
MPVQQVIFVISINPMILSITTGFAFSMISISWLSEYYSCLLGPMEAYLKILFSKKYNLDMAANFYSCLEILIK